MLLQRTILIRVLSQTHLCCEFTNTYCSDKENIQVFLNNLCVKKAELFAINIVISDDDYQNSII